MTHFLAIILHLDTQIINIITNYGIWIYALLFAVIFCETGIIFMAMLPGDSLLFVVGALAARGMLDIYLAAILLLCAAFSGNLLNYWLGKKFGNWLMQRPNSCFFNRKHLAQTNAFYTRNGGKTLIIGYFIPIIRTFAAFVAGIANMNSGKFLLFNALGVSIWILSLLTISYLFGNIPVVKEHFSFIVIAIIFISLLPAIINFLLRKKQSN